MTRSLKSGISPLVALYLSLYTRYSHTFFEDLCAHLWEADDAGRRLEEVGAERVGEEVGPEGGRAREDKAVACAHAR